MGVKEEFVIQKLESLLINGYGKDELLPVFKCFKTKRDEDVQNFLVENAIDYENSGAGRTYLVMNKNNKNDIFGYFTLGLNTLRFEEGFDDVKDAYPGIELYNNKQLPVYALFLMGKNDSCPEGFSMAKVFKKDVLNLVSEAKKRVGGSILYLDCIDDLVTYYKKLGFKEFGSHIVDDPNEGQIRLNTMIRSI